MRDRELSSSSVSPSEKYSWLGTPLMFTKGSTAMECGGGANVTGVTGTSVFPATRMPVTGMWWTRQSASRAIPAPMAAASAMLPTTAVRRNRPGAKDLAAATASVPMYARRSGDAHTGCTTAGIGALVTGLEPTAVESDGVALFPAFHGATGAIS